MSVSRLRFFFHAVFQSTFLGDVRAPRENGDGFALARHGFGFGHGCFHGLKFIRRAGRRNSCFPLRKLAGVFDYLPFRSSEEERSREVKFVMHWPGVVAGDSSFMFTAWSGIPRSSSAHTEDHEPLRSAGQDAHRETPSSASPPRNPARAHARRETPR